ncbi:hypothetical protein ACLOJK_026421 [Asimina triloba]
MKDARAMIATHEHSEIAAAVNLLDAALVLSPRLEAAMELKARSLLYLRRFKEVADMLQDHIPSYKMALEESWSSSSLSSDNSLQQLPKDRVKLLSDTSSGPASDRDITFKCFSVSDLKRKVLAGLCKNCEKEGQWRYLVLGQACCHLGLMEDAMVLLQTGKRLASAAFRRESVCWSDDSFSFSNATFSGDISHPNAAPPSSEAESTAQLLANIKLLLRRRAAALAALDAGLHSEAIRHFSKILDGRRSTPQRFLADCYIHRAAAYRAAGRIAEAIADCNRTLALSPSSIPALSTRSALLESIRCYPDCLRDLEHLKLLYDAILRDRKLPGPAWKHHTIRYRDAGSNLRNLASKIQEMRQRVASGESLNVDYYALIGLRRGCTRSELERAHLLLTLRHRPDKSIAFIDRCEFVDDRDVDAVRDQARMSALILYRLLQKGYSNIMAAIMDVEAAEKQRQRAAAASATAAVAAIQTPIPATTTRIESQLEAGTKRKMAEQKELENRSAEEFGAGLELPPSEETTAAAAASIFQGVFCRDLAIVGNLISQAGFNRPLPVKYEALSC